MCTLCANLCEPACTACKCMRSMHSSYTKCTRGVRSMHSTHKAYTKCPGGRRSLRGVCTMTDMRATYPFCRSAQACRKGFGSLQQDVRPQDAPAYCRLIVGIRSHCLDGKLMLSFQRLDSVIPASTSAPVVAPTVLDGVGLLCAPFGPANNCPVFSSRDDKMREHYLQCFKEGSDYRTRLGRSDSDSDSEFRCPGSPWHGGHGHGSDGPSPRAAD